ncbi:peptidase M16 domain-containing protein [Nitratireductor indicus C115]|uniref:Peptidase M16 domain-containing protein n=1 Tax=Nitratireductor indicus C115 TaxID=1231190 RepID=K2PJ86_9HYPH|nr:pitrilysin family protein [Nitratireductor indicus]EKF41212.1 peptidase M16 domain-containing protein [Nitratireductor indicus C115]SFQ64773.1 zinc protease [Nitratireductor indicus]
MRYSIADAARRAALALVVSAALPLAALAEEAGEKTDVSSFTLDNGMQVVVIPDHRAPVVTHMVWYKVGSADEAPGKSGIAHFFEHLMFKGTSTYTNGEFSKAVADVGGNENAFTSYDYTAYYQQVAPSELGEMMGFEADRMRHLVLSEENIETERQVVLEERRQRTDNVPSAILSEELNATLYQNHPYGIPVIGWEREVEGLTHDDLKAFYDRFYTPNNAILVVAGDVEPDEVRQLAEKSYGAIPRGPDLPQRTRPMEPDQKTARSVTFSDPRVTVPNLSINWFVPSQRRAEKGEFEALAILSEVLGEGLRSRLYQELVVKQGIAASAGSYLQASAYDYSGLVVYGEPRGDADLAAVEKALAAEIERIKKDGITAEELETARKKIERDMIFARDSQVRTANIFGATLATGGSVEDITGLSERLAAVTPDSVKAVAQRYLDLSHAVKGYLLPKEEEKRS